MIEAKIINIGDKIVITDASKIAYDTYITRDPVTRFYIERGDVELADLSVGPSKESFQGLEGSVIGLASNGNIAVCVEFAECNYLFPISRNALKICSKSEPCTQSDAVNHPSHYTAGKVETIEYIEGVLGKEHFYNYCLGNVIKYVSRAKLKGKELEDYKKAQWYLSKAIDVLEDLQTKAKESSTEKSDEAPVRVIGYISHQQGTAKLVRENSKGIIKICYRKGKPRNTRDAVCISDGAKVSFFNDCKSACGSGNVEYVIHEGSPFYSKWSEFIDKQFIVDMTSEGLKYEK